MKKESIGLHVMWHIDVLLQALHITTSTLNKTQSQQYVPYS